MKRLLLAAAITAIAGPAFAQYVVIQPEVREYIIQEAPTIAYDYEYEGDIEVGTILPDDIRIFDIDDPEIETEYGYTIVEDRRVLVEPGTRRIIHVVD